MSCLTLHFKIKGQGHDIDMNLFEFRDIDLVLIDTTHKFLPCILPEISYWMRYLMFDLKFQGQRSRSQPWYLFFWIPWHPLSNRGHQRQVSITCTTRDIILNALRHVWPWISRSRSQYWHIIVWIPLHQFSGNRYKKLRLYRIAIKRYRIMSRGQKWPLPVLLGSTVL